MTLYINNDSLFNLNLIFFSFFERIFKVVSRGEINTHILNYKIGEKKKQHLNRKPQQDSKSGQNGSSDC